MTRKTRGFTLIELMLVVAIIGILAAIMIPKMANLIRKSQDAAVLGHLGTLRSAMSLYYADNEGISPTAANDLSDYLVPRFLNEIPSISVPGYPGIKSNRSCTIAFNDNHCHVGANPPHVWVYDNVSEHIRVNCTHTDNRGVIWTMH